MAILTCEVLKNWRQPSLSHVPSSAIHWDWNLCPSYTLSCADIGYLGQDEMIESDPKRWQFQLETELETESFRTCKEPRNTLRGNNCSHAPLRHLPGFSMLKYHPNRGNLTTDFPLKS